MRASSRRTNALTSIMLLPRLNTRLLNVPVDRENKTQEALQKSSSLNLHSLITQNAPRYFIKRVKESKILPPMTMLHLSIKIFPWYRRVSALYHRSPSWKWLFSSPNHITIIYYVLARPNPTPLYDLPSLAQNHGLIRELVWCCCLLSGDLTHEKDSPSARVQQYRNHCISQ